MITRIASEPGFVESMQNITRQKKNLIKNRLTQLETIGRGERMELNSRSNIDWDRMMRSNSFETQQMREISRKKAGE